MPIAYQAIHFNVCNAQHWAKRKILGILWCCPVVGRICHIFPRSPFSFYATRINIVCHLSCFWEIWDFYCEWFIWFVRPRGGNFNSMSKRQHFSWILCNLSGNTTLNLDILMSLCTYFETYFTCSQYAITIDRRLEIFEMILLSLFSKSSRELIEYDGCHYSF